ncbi:hypothetical protein BGX23_011014 [Mortierella sp. AD031]|nr:hypothetical protein BGX23_011014 [Mortierella sp. AD031]KAG0204264.1 hypothetical protein BGX33_008598 [Mortierella sp. NVP41]
MKLSILILSFTAAVVSALPAGNDVAQADSLETLQWSSTTRRPVVVVPVPDPAAPYPAPAPSAVFRATTAVFASPSYAPAAPSGVPKACHSTTLRWMTLQHNKKAKGKVGEGEYANFFKLIIDDGRVGRIETKIEPAGHGLIKRCSNDGLFCVEFESREKGTALNLIVNGNSYVHPHENAWYETTSAFGGDNELLGSPEYWDCVTL